MRRRERAALRAAQRAEIEAQLRQQRAELEAQVRRTVADFEEANARVTARAGRNLVFAVGVGIVFGGLFLVSLIIFKPLFLIFAAAVVGTGVWELATALRGAGREVPRIASIIVGALAVPAAFWYHIGGLWLALGAGILLVSGWCALKSLLPAHRRPPRRVFADVVAGAFIQLYVTFLAGLLVVLTSHPGGEWWTLGAVITIISVDIGAYAAGVLFGRHPMAPRISPKKTWEGLAGAAVLAIVAAVLVSWLLFGVSPWFGLPFGVAILGTATFGDLVESLIKRDLGVKDMSSFLPGHGGLLDRLDSILPSAAVAYAAYVVAALWR